MKTLIILLLLATGTVYGQIDNPPTSVNIVDSTATGRAVLTATNAAAARTGLGLGTTNNILVASEGIVSSLDNGTPWTMSKLSANTAGTNSPVRILFLGDSLSTGLGIGPLMARSGVFQGSGVQSSTGGYSNVVNSSFTFNGRYDAFPTNSTGVYTEGGSATGDVLGSQVCIIYVREPGAGTFDLETSSNAGSTWVTAGTINASHTNTVSASETYSVSTSNLPRYRLRVANVTNGPVKIIGWGIYNQDGGGVIGMSGLFNEAGIDITPANELTDGLLNGVWNTLAPDLVLSCWADGATNWQSGGAFRNFYSRTKALRAQTDWVQISRNPASDETGSLDQRLTQLDWARSANESYFDGHSLFRSYSDALAKGLMGDVVHLSVAGTRMRNFHLWNTLALGYVPMGRSPIQGIDNNARLSGNSFSPGFSTRGNGTAAAGVWAMSGSALNVPGTLSIFPSDYTPGPGSQYNLVNDGTNLSITIPGATIATTGASSLRGWHPGNDNNMLGARGNLRWRAGLTGIQLGYRAVTNSVTFGTDDHVINVTNATPTITLPAAVATSTGTTTSDNVGAGIAGKVFVLKNSTTNAITVATTSSQQIDGAAPGTLDGGQSLRVMSTGSGWITIPGTTGVPALTNTSNVALMRALSGSTNTNHPFSGTVSVVGTNNTNTLVFSNGILQEVQ
jgi:hypothetical protein